MRVCMVHFHVPVPIYVCSVLYIGYFICVYVLYISKRVCIVYCIFLSVYVLYIVYLYKSAATPLFTD